MNPLTLTLEELREVGLRALSKVLGPVGAIRFIQQFEKGKGDYTKERSKILKKTTFERVKNWCLKKSK